MATISSVSRPLLPVIPIQDLIADPGTAGQQLAASISGGSSSLTENFGYQATTSRSVSGSIWSDTITNGVIDGTETGLAGVTIELLQGATVIATTTTASDGTYSFDNIASGLYTVRITDTSGVLSGYSTTYEKTEGTTAPFNNEESVDLTSGNVINVNFGYKKPAPPLFPFVLRRI